MRNQTEIIIIPEDYDDKIPCPYCKTMTDQLFLFDGYGSTGWYCNDCYGNRIMEE